MEKNCFIIVYIFVVNGIAFYLVQESIMEQNTISSDAAAVTTDKGESGISDYEARVKNSPEYSVFASDYDKTIELVKTNLDNLAFNHQKVDEEALISSVFRLLDDCKTMIQVLDIMYDIPESAEAVYHHSLNVAVISVILARWINMGDEDIRQLALAGVLHDIGKLSIPPEILNKTGKLTDEEFAMIKNHVKYGYNIAKNNGLDVRILEAITSHHERCDGSGYPFGYKGDHIPEFGKIIAIGDVYDAMISSRSYRSKHCPFDVLQMFDFDGLNKYDPKYIMTFMNNIVNAYVNNSVRLSDGRIGEIVMVNRSCLYRPIVKCGDDFVDLTKHTDISIESIL